MNLPWGEIAVEIGLIKEMIDLDDEITRSEGEAVAGGILDTRTDEESVESAV